MIPFVPGRLAHVGVRRLVALRLHGTSPHTEAPAAAVVVFSDRAAIAMVRFPS
jgi:hypothetical protein